MVYKEKSRANLLKFDMLKTEWQARFFLMESSIIIIVERAGVTNIFAVVVVLRSPKLVINSYDKSQ